MTTRVVAAILAGILLVAFPAYGEEDEAEAFYGRAQRLEKDGHHEKAIDAYELVIREWGLDGAWAVKCHLRIAECLVKLGRIEDAIHVLEVAKDRYGEAAEARKAIDQSLKKLWRKARGEGRGDEKWERRLEELERHLKEQGLTGEELRDAYERARRQMEEARKARGLAEKALRTAKDQRGQMEAKIERMVGLWKESGVSAEEIEERVARLREQHERMEAAHREIEELARRLHEEGVPEEEIHREVKELERRLNDEMDEGWRGRREQETDAARREFLHLAERLGIPVHEAERFLEEHARRGRREHPERSDEPFHREGPNPNRVAEKVEAMEDFIFRLEDTLGRLMNRLEKMERRLAELEER